MRDKPSSRQFLRRDDGNQAVTSVATLSVAAIVLLGVQHLAVWVLDDTKSKLQRLTSDEPVPAPTQSGPAVPAQTFARMVRIGEQAAVRTATVGQFFVVPGTDNSASGIPNEPTAPQPPVAPGQPELPNEPAVPGEPELPNEPAVPGEPELPNEPAAPEEPETKPPAAPTKDPAPKPRKQKTSRNDPANAPQPAGSGESAEPAEAGGATSGSGTPAAAPPPSAGGGFPGAGFPGAGFPGAGFPGAGFPGAGFPGAGFPGTGFPGAGFPGAGFPGAGFPGAGFPGGQLISAGVPTSPGTQATVSSGVADHPADSQIATVAPGRRPILPAAQPLSLPSVQPEAEPAEAAEAEQFTATGGIEVQGLDRRNPQRPQLRIVCGRAYRQLQVHAGNRRLAFNAPRPGELRRLPLPPEWAEPGTLLTLYGIESTTSEQLEWMVPPLQSGVGAGAQPAGAATTAADPTASESSREEQPQADDGQDSPPVDDLQPSTEPYREE